MKGHLGPVIDTAATVNVFRDVENAKRCNVLLRGENSTKRITWSGNVGGLTKVLQNKTSPGDLISLMRLFEDGPWEAFLFLPDAVYGLRQPEVDEMLQMSARHDLVATLSENTHGFYRAKPIVLDPTFGTKEATKDRGKVECTKRSRFLKQEEHDKETAMVSFSTNDTTELCRADALMRRLGMPSPEMIRLMLKHGTVKGLDVDAAYLKRYRLLSAESRLKGSMTVPKYRKSARNEEAKSKVKLEYLDKMVGDSRKLMVPGPNGETHVFTLVDEATRTPFTFLHRGWKQLSVLIERLLNQILDDARVNLKMVNPSIKKIKLDGHPTQVGRTREVVAEVDAMLTRRQIFVPPLPPGDHPRMGIVERMHQSLSRIAVSLFHELGQGLPPSFLAYAQLHASKVKDCLAQKLLGGKSSFEMRNGHEPGENDVPYPTLFSTGMAKNMDANGMGGKKGFDIIGVVIDTGTNAPAGKQLMRLWMPDSGEKLWRTGVNINEAFTTFGRDRIVKMRAGERVHGHTDVSTRVTTRSEVHAASRIQTERILVPGKKVQFYRYATRHGVPVHRPYLCDDVGCVHHNHEEGFKSLAGLRRHYSSKLRKAEKIKAAADAAVLEVSRLKREQQLMKDAAKAARNVPLRRSKRQAREEIVATVALAVGATSRKSALAMSRKSWHDARLKRETSNLKKYLSHGDKSRVDTKDDKDVSRRRWKEAKSRRARKLEEFLRPVDKFDIMNETCVQSGEHRSAFMAAVSKCADEEEHAHQKRVFTKRKVDVGAIARRRKQAELDTMRCALHPPEDMDKTMADYVVSEAEQQVIDMYNGIKYERDKSPQYDVDNDFLTLRVVLKIPGAEEDAKDVFMMKRDPGEANIPNNDDHTCRDEYVFRTMQDGRPHLTEENADRWTPANIRELQRSPYYKEWMLAMEAEIATLNKYHVFKFVNLDKSFKRVTLRWIYKIKFKDGVLDKFKARLVARGFTQRPILDYDPTGVSAPVGRASTFKVVFAEGVKNRHYFGEFDVKAAYLLSELAENVYAALPYGVRRYGFNSLKLERSLYGLRQAGYNWNKKFTGVLESLGFVQSESDPCLFTYRKGTDLVRVVLWVDDGLVSTNNKELWLKMQAKLHEVTPLGHKGKLEWLLGMRIFWDRKTGILRLSQKSKIVALLERYNMQNCRAQELPLPKNTALSADGPISLEEEMEVVKKVSKTHPGIKDYADLIKFCREVIGSIGYLACWGRPDVRHAVYYLARYQARPSVTHYKMIKHLLRYMKGTQDLTLTFGTRSLQGPPLVCMVDSNYIGDGDGCYSTTGYVFYYYGCPILCESKKQTAISTGTTEAELIAASHAIRTGIYLRRLLINDFGMSDEPTMVGEDNQGCVHISRGGGNHAGKRHMRVADSYSYQEVKLNKSHSIRYVRSRDNVSDIFTKAADPVTFKRLRWYLMGDTPDDDSEIDRNQGFTYHWLDEDDVGNAPVEECWRMDE